MIDVVAKLWDFCSYLRHEGITYGNYIEQLTYLLFLKMAKEKESELPKGCTWDDLIKKSGSEILETYSLILQTLGKEKGMLGDIFARSRSEFSNPTNLKKLLNLIDEIDWFALPVDVKGAAYEGLLEKFASEEKGAGEYFTPRILIQSIVKCVKPDFRNSEEFTIHDPACGTGGFLIGAFEWIKEQTKGGSKLSIPDRNRLLKKTFSGMDNVVMTRRLALMNCYLHSIEPTIFFGDSLGEGSHVGQRYNVVLSNPPFGTRGAGGAPSRDDFLVKTANKQLNFVQHIITILKIGGIAAIVVPDSVLFDNSGKKIREHLLKSCNLHTLLRLPEGTFQPYAGVKANVFFITKGKPTEEVWYYDLRTNIQNINKGNALTEKLFEDFEKCYQTQPRKTSTRFKKITIDEIKENNFELDISVMDDKNTLVIGDLTEQNILIKEISKNLLFALKSIDKLLKNLGENK